MIRPIALLVLVAGTGAAAAQPPAGGLSPDEQKAAELLRANKPDEALTALQQAAKANPQLPPARVMFADLFYRGGNAQQARQQLERAAVEEPAHPDVLLLNAKYALAEGRVTDALFSFEAAVKEASSPRWPAAQAKRFTRDARLGLAAAYQARQDFKSARGQIMAVIADDPKNGPLRTQAAAAAFLAGEPDRAIAELQAAYADDKTLDPPELTFARLCDAKRDAAQAEEWFKKAVAAHGQNVRVVRGYAQWLLDRNRAADAQPHLDAMTKLDPAGPETRAVLGMAARYRKDYPAAEKIFDELNRESPGNPFFGWNLSISLAESDDPKKRDRAVQLAESVFRQNERLPESVAVLGWCYLKAGRADDAQRALNARLQAGNLTADTAYFVARLLESRGGGADAQKILREATAQPGAFVYRKDAEALLAELDKKNPPAKDDKKPEEKK